MPTIRDHPAQDGPRRGLFSAKASAISIVAASIVTLGVAVVMLSSEDEIRVQSIPAQPNTGSQFVATPTNPLPGPVLPPPQAPVAQAAAPLTPAPQPPALAMDAQGYIDSARCLSGQRAVATARTERAAIVICEVSDGTFEYQGVRLNDGASLQLDDVRPITAGFEARNEGTTYRLSPTELVVITGEALQSRDAVVEYRGAS